MKHAWSAGLWVLLVVWLVAGCSAPRLSPEVRPGFNLTGTWALDPSGTDSSFPR